MESSQSAIALRLEGKTYREIGEALGVTRQRAQQILSPLTEVEDAVIARAGGRCEGCQVPAGRSGHIHHRQVKGLTPETYNAEPNLTLLCAACHRTAHWEETAYARRQKRIAADSTRTTERHLRPYRIGAQKLGISIEEYRQHRDSGKRWCTWHQRWEPESAFGKKVGYCLEGNREYVRQHQGAEYSREYRKRNRDKVNAYHNDWAKRKRAKQDALQQQDDRSAVAS